MPTLYFQFIYSVFFFWSRLEFMHFLFVAFYLSSMAQLSLPLSLYLLWFN